MRVLMCKPSYFDITEKDAYGNTHMDPGQRPDKELAGIEHKFLAAVYSSLGIDVRYIDPVPGLPDMTFTANCGLTFMKDGKHHVIISNFRPERRHREQERFHRYFADELAYTTVVLPHGIYFEGAGDAIPFGDSIFVGYGFRTSREALPHLAAATGKRIIPLELKRTSEGPAVQYHLDTALMVFERDRVVVAYKGAFTPSSYEELRREVGRAGGTLLEASYEDAASLALNAVVVHKECMGDDKRSNFTHSRGVVITSYSASGALIKTILSRGYIPVTTPLAEFLKSGGGAFCLTKILC